MKTDQEKLEAKIGKVCLSIWKKEHSPESGKARVMALISFPALPPLKWEETRSHQSQMCPLTHDSYTLTGSVEDLYFATMIPAKDIRNQVVSDGRAREIAIAAIEQHRNDNLKKKLGL